MTEMVEVLIDSVRVSLMSAQRVIILRQGDIERYLAVWIGPYEADAITVALQEVEVVRPLTHDLLKNVFGVLDARVKRVEITDLQTDIFYAKVVVEANDKTFEIDSRPSDAIALAVRVHVPILVSQAVMDEAGIVPEKDIQNQQPGGAEGEPPLGPGADGQDRLSIFEDFLNNLEDKPDDTELPKN
ncbi:MAG: bifunctional nuclease family protein [Chloroflexota bacterium]